MSAAAGTFGGPRNLLAAAAFLAGLAVVTHVSGFGILGVALFPFAFFLVGFHPAVYLLLTLAGFIVFFQAGLSGSNAWVLNSPDLALPALLGFAFFARRSLNFSLPWSPLLASLYAFLAYAALLSIGPALTLGPLDFWFLRDLKCLLYLAAAAYFCRNPLLGPKALVLVLLATTLMAAVHGAFCVAESFLTGWRVITWNEIYIADGLAIGLALLEVPQLARWRKALIAALGVMLVSLVVTETRGVWMGALAALLLYAAITVFTSSRARLKRIGVGLAAFVLATVLLLTILRLAANYDLLDRVGRRMAEGSVMDLVDPYSSMGYRIHESYVVWEQRSWLGHGTGARLRLFFTQIGFNQVIDWWSIHSEYFEILHKYGFVGLGLFLLFLWNLARSALRLALLRKAVPAAMGRAVLLCLTVHAVTSITSGYFLRENVAIFLMLLVVIVENFRPAATRAAARRSGGPPP